jgi:hypothetical protein
MRLILIFFLQLICFWGNSQNVCFSVTPGINTGSFSIFVTNTSSSVILVTNLAVNVDDNHLAVTVNGTLGNRFSRVVEITIPPGEPSTIITGTYTVSPPQSSGSVVFSLSNPYLEIDGFPSAASVGACSPVSVFFSPLPITLHTFSATQHSERASRLNWTTSSEINSAYFGIERSRDGDTWDAIGKVDAAGNSHTELAYEYIDDNLPFSRTADQIYYYRLRLTDLDGSHKYSDIKAVNFSRKPSDGIAIYPNPAIQMVHLDISTMDAAAGEIDLRIYDIHGRIMADKTIIGAGIEPIDVTQYPIGTYNITVTQGNTQHQKRFIKIE